MTAKKKELSIDDLKKRIKDLLVKIDKLKDHLNNKKTNLKLVLDEIENIEDQLGADILIVPENIMENYSQKKNEKKQIETEIYKIESKLWGTTKKNNTTSLIYKHDTFYQKLMRRIIEDDDVREYIMEKRISKQNRKIEKLLKNKLIDNKYDIEKINDDNNILDLMDDILYKLAVNEEITRELPSNENILNVIDIVLSEKGIVGIADVEKQIEDLEDYLSIREFCKEELKEENLFAINCSEWAIKLCRKYNSKFNKNFKIASFRRKIMALKDNS